MMILSNQVIFIYKIVYCGKIICYDLYTTSKVVLEKRIRDWSAILGYYTVKCMENLADQNIF